MTTHQIAYFLKLAEDLNYTSVANYFYITQPTLSRQIMNLETELGFPLFLREKNGIRITQEGEKLYKGLVPLKKDFLHLLQSIQKSYSQKHNSLLIGIMDEQLISNPLLLALNILHEKCPHIDYQFRRSSHFQLWQGLVNGVYDLINVIFMPQDKNKIDDRISFLTLESEKSYIAIEKSMEPDLPDCINEVQLMDLLKKYPLYLPSIESPSSYNPLELFMEQVNLSKLTFRPDIRISADLLSTPMQILARMGITITNKGNLFSVDPNIRIIEIESAQTYQKGICYRNSSDNPNLLRLIDILKHSPL